MNTARYDFSMVLIPNSAVIPSGRIIVAGGLTTAGALIPTGTASERFDVNPGTTWTPVTGFTPRSQLQMVVLSVFGNNLVVAAGGLVRHFDPIKYDPGRRVLTGGFPFIVLIHTCFTRCGFTPRLQLQVLVLDIVGNCLLVAAGGLVRTSLHRIVA